MDPVLDFGSMIRQAGLAGTLDPNSIRVIDVASGRSVPRVIGAAFWHGDKGRVEWVVAQPDHTEYEIRFRTVPKRPLLAPQRHTPRIGTGDLLRYNAGTPQPITLYYAARLVDLNSDGRADLAGCWNYAYRPGDPWDGVVCYPRVAGPDSLEFADLVRLRYTGKAPGGELTHFRHTYMAVDFADFNRDGQIDLVLTRRGTGTAQFFLNTSRRETGGMPVFAPPDSVRVAGWKACRAVDLNCDGAIDLVVDGQFVRNSNPAGWPFRPAAPITLDAGREPSFLDLDQDDHPDSICLQGGPEPQPDGYRVAWRRNLGGDPPRFGPQQLLADVDADWCTLVAAAADHGRQGLLVQHDVYQQLSFYELIGTRDDQPQFRHRGRASSRTAVLSLSDQAWPCLCDWDGDGDRDLLVGGGYGWPRIVINDGTDASPAYCEPQRIMAAGQPIRLLRNEILGEPLHWHNMGYVFPVYVDWDDDQLPDLVCPNETNRIFWYQNIGTRRVPQFGPRQQILVDGQPDSPSARRRSAELALEATYPKEPGRPFFWRTASAVADWTGDGLTDLVTLDGHTRAATLFAQYRDGERCLRLRRVRTLTLIDGRPVDDRIVARSTHWTEGFRAIDWDDDGLVDLLYSCAGAHHAIQDGGSIFLLRNAGSKTDPVFEPPATIRCFGAPIRITNHGPHPWPGDADGDGTPDLVACVEWSVYPFYRHAALMMSARPQFVLQGPRPCHPDSPP